MRPSVGFGPGDGWVRRVKTGEKKVFIAKMA